MGAKMVNELVVHCINVVHYLLAAKLPSNPLISAKLVANTQVHRIQFHLQCS